MPTVTVSAAGESVTLTYSLAVRPSGPGYVRYEDLYRTGDTVSQACNRLSASSPGANADGTAYITFPEGVFAFDDLKGAPGAPTAPYGIYVPKNCKGFRGSGKGTLGDRTRGTIFTVNPNTWTGTSPMQSTKSPNQAAVIYRGTGAANGVPIIFDNFQIAGTTQGDVDGKCFSGIVLYNPESPAKIDNVLATGWYGDNGGPPGETFGGVIHDDHNTGPHRITNSEADGRRVVGGPNFGAVGFTLQNCLGGSIDNCYSHFCQSNQFVLFQTANVTTSGLIIGDTSGSEGVNHDPGVAVACFNHERTTGSVHTRPVFNTKAGARAGVHMTHSNDSYTGNGFVTNNGTLKVVDPQYKDIWGDGLFYVQSWTPYNNGDTQSVAPVVVKADGVTHLPYEWVHGPHIFVT